MHPLAWTRSFPPQIGEENMLVLSRHRDERIMVTPGVILTIVDIRGDKVRLGIQAPADVPVHRREVFDAIERENRRATPNYVPKTPLDLTTLPAIDTKSASGMLVLSRKRNESIVINGNVEIVIVEVRGDKVRLGIEAPKEYPVHRLEVYEAMQAPAAQAAPPQPE